MLLPTTKSATHSEASKRSRQRHPQCRHHYRRLSHIQEMPDGDLNHTMQLAFNTEVSHLRDTHTHIKKAPTGLADQLPDRPMDRKVAFSRGPSVRLSVRPSITFLNF